MPSKRLTWIIIALLIGAAVWWGLEMLEDQYEALRPRLEKEKAKSP